MLNNVLTNQQLSKSYLITYKIIFIKRKEKTVSPIPLTYTTEGSGCINTPARGYETAVWRLQV